MSGGGHLLVGLGASTAKPELTHGGMSMQPTLCSCGEVERGTPSYATWPGCCQQSRSTRSLPRGHVARPEPGQGGHAITPGQGVQLAALLPCSWRLARASPLTVNTTRGTSECRPHAAD